MKVNKICFEPRSFVKFYVSEAETLMECAKSHYDAECKKAAEQGGLVFMIRNTVEFGTYAKLTRDNLDLMLKILECDPNPGSQIGKGARALLSEQIRALFDEMNRSIPKSVKYEKA